MKRLLLSARVALPLALVVAPALAADATGAPKHVSGTLQLQAEFAAGYSFSTDFCPPETPAGVRCYRFVGVAEVSGLGHATETYTNRLFDERFCPSDRPLLQFRTAVIDVAGKGQIDLSMAGPHCGPPAPYQIELEGTITGGSGMYAGASGSLRFGTSTGAYEFRCNCGRAKDVWTGTLTVSGVEFDVTPPVLKGAVSRTVRAPKKARRVRVRYTVTAQDVVDASVPAVCKPRSGSRFKVGRTAVTCTATDSSANTATRKFTITVKKNRR